MNTKHKISFAIMFAIIFIFGSGLTMETFAEITAFVRTDKAKYLEGEAISTWIALKVTGDPITVDEDFLQRTYFERLLDVRDPNKNKLQNKYYETSAGEDDPKPRNPAAKKTVLQSKTYDVLLEDLREHFNIGALGPHTLRFGISLTTYDPSSGNPTNHIISSKIDKFEIVRENAVAVDINPNTLSLKSKGKWITAYVSAFPASYSASNVILSSIILGYNGGTVPLDWSKIQGDILMLKFDRASVQDMLSPADAVEIWIKGKFSEFESFTGSDTIRVIEKGGGKK